MESLQIIGILFLSFYHVSSFGTGSQKVIQKRSVFDTIPVNMPYEDKEVPLVYEQVLHQYRHDNTGHLRMQELRKEKALKLRQHFQRIEIEQYTKLKNLLIRRIQNAAKMTKIKKENHYINKDKSITIFNL